ncbi:hypothetical protein B296_00012303 [Ensete ventricosum]|uniref:Uncharacterized protein n=1 Tax=Ensete ventricosum TaxID=4639 RepID=A0A427B982_ENSVE|nr:hypothetical protein B296_00012303 [Ensete ventricosum]
MVAARPIAGDRVAAVGPIIGDLPIGSNVSAKQRLLEQGIGGCAWVEQRLSRGRLRWPAVGKRSGCGKEQQ